MIGNRLLEVGLLFLASAAVIAVRLYDLQVRESAFWEEEALKARTRSRSLPFRRGSILDCEGRLIAKSESSYDVQFDFREFRLESTTGQLLLVHYLLTGKRLSVRSVLRDPKSVLEEAVHLDVRRFRSLEPRRRRLDLLAYLAWLTDEKNSSGLTEGLSDAPLDRALAPSLGRLRERVLEKVWRERSYLGDLEVVLDLPAGAIAERIDEAIAWVDGRVLKQLEGRDVEERAFEVERALHTEYDVRSRLLLEDVPHAEFFHLQVEEKPLAGLSLRECTRRVYPHDNDVCSLLIGAVGRPREADLVSAAEGFQRFAELRVSERSHEQEEEMERLLQAWRRDVYREGEESGRFGLEAMYEDLLRGRRGWLKEIAEREGQRLRVLECVEAEHGRDLQLTLDCEMQVEAEAALKRHRERAAEARRQGEADDPLDWREWRGAFVLLELPDMAIRVLASYPERGRADLERLGLVEEEGDTSRPINPEAWRPYYPPPLGSVIKPLLAAKSLSEGMLTPASTLLCAPGSLVANGRAVSCLGTHGDVEMHTAVYKSCNQYFARLSHRAGYSKMFEWCEAFGFGAPTHFASAALDDGRRFDGLEPEEFVRELSRSGMSERNLMLFGIGQGAIDDVTPLTVAAAMGALAMRAHVPPTIIDRVGGERPRRPLPRSLSFPSDAWHAVVQSMRAVTVDPRGTARPTAATGLDLTGYDLATKTGTPQIGGRADSSWFAGFFPAHEPRYAFAVFLSETGAHGGEVCAPIFQDVLQSEAFVEVEAVARRQDR